MHLFEVLFCTFQKPLRGGNLRLLKVFLLQLYRMLIKIPLVHIVGTLYTVSIP